MDAVTAHYHTLLAQHYTWMLGGDLESVAAGARDVLESFGLRPGALAVDLGCGPGPHALALADMGFASVIGVDMSRDLLDELAEHARGRPAVRAVQGDLLNVLPEVSGDVGANAIVCMGDTLLHLRDKGSVLTLFRAVASSLASEGVFVASYRDLTQPLDGLDRFIPVRADEERIMLCALERRGPDTVTVNDLIYTRAPGGWGLSKGSYQKLRLAPGWVRDQLSESGLEVTHHAPAERGIWTTVAVRRG